MDTDFTVASNKMLATKNGQFINHEITEYETLV